MTVGTDIPVGIVIAEYVSKAEERRSIPIVSPILTFSYSVPRPDLRFHGNLHHSSSLRSFIDI